MTFFYLTVLLPLLIAGVLVAGLRSPASVLGLVDRPSERKQHSGDVPLVGGIAVFLAFIAVLPVLDISRTSVMPLMAGMVLLLFCGILDDLVELRSMFKCCIQAVAAGFIVLWGNTEVVSLGTVPVFGQLDLGWVAAPFTILVVVGFINAMNMIDGLDGLAGGVAVVMLGWLAFCAVALGADGVLMVIVSFAAAIGGFLWFNMRHPWQRSAKVFLGDAGSMPIGLAVAWFAIEVSNSPHSSSGIGISPAAIAWILAVPVIDTISVMTRRMIRGISPFTPGRDHLHHMLLHLGQTPGQATATMMALTASAGAFGVLGSNAGISDFVLLTGLFGLALAHAVGLRRARWIIVRRLEQVQRDPNDSKRLGT